MFDGTWGTTYVAKEPVNYPWQQSFAWFPVRVHGKLKWLAKVWRKRVSTYGDQRLEPALYEYGNLFDVIRDER